MASQRHPLRGVATAALGLLVLALLLATPARQQAAATHTPANKVFASGSTMEEMTTQVGQGRSSSVRTLLSGRIKTSAPTDLIISVTAECALWTNITTIGNDQSEAIATVKVWVEIDGRALPVSADDSREPGKVVFCNRAFKMVTTDFDDEDSKIELFLKTRSANSFNWVALNVGSGPTLHTIEVKAQLDSEVTTTAGEARAIVGKRTLVVFPEKLANDAEI